MTRAWLSLLLALFLPLRIADAHEPNDCVIQAARAQAELPRRAWSRLLVVSYPNVGTGHCYLVYEWPAGHVWAYDTARGSRLIYPRNRTPEALTAAADPLALFGCYVEEQPAAALTPRHR